MSEGVLRWAAGRVRKKLLASAGAKSQPMAQQVWRLTLKLSPLELLPRGNAKEVSSNHHAVCSEAKRRPSSPLLNAESVGLLAVRPTLVDGEACTASRRSVVTHAVLGSEAAGLRSLPHELLMAIFSRLDAASLCRLSQVSTSCNTFADDPMVWAHSPAGHMKEVERAKHLQAVQIAADRRAAEARWRQQRWRHWKRRALSVLQAVCGVVLVLVPLLVCLGRRKAPHKAPSHITITSSGGSVPALVPLTHRVCSQAVEHMPYESIVWAAATCTRPRAGS